MELDNAVFALSWRRSSEVRNPSKQKQKKNPSHGVLRAYWLPAGKGKYTFSTSSTPLSTYTGSRTSLGQQRNTSARCFS
jgi:hypothetical protein